MSDYVKRNACTVKFAHSGSWVILSPIEESIKRKIEAVGVPLKDWDIQINYGIKTGCNEAFIIKTERRDAILAACADEAERERTEKLIRPILRGRDIKRYGYQWADLWLINAHNGVKGRIERIHIEDYPAVKGWLDNGGIAFNGKEYKGYSQLEKRADQGDTPYNLRNCAYMEDFDKPKIVWIELTDESKFAYSEDGIIPLNTIFFMVGENLPYLLANLNSKLIHWYFTTCLGCTSGVGTNRWLKFTIEQLPIKPNTGNIKWDNLIDGNFNNEIETSLAQLYGLSKDETEFIVIQ